MHLHVIQLQPEELKITRDEFSLRLEEEGVANSVHYLPLHLHKYYKEGFGCQPDDCPAATAAYDRIVSLPIFPDLADDEVVYVAEQICNCVCGTAVRLIDENRICRRA